MFFGRTLLPCVINPLNAITSNFQIFSDFKCAYTPELRKKNVFDFRAGSKSRAAWVTALLGPASPVQDRKNRAISYDASGT